MKVRRTTRSYVEDDLDFRSFSADTETMDVMVGGKPAYSNVLGPDGFFLEYEEEPVWFDLRR